MAGPTVQVRFADHSNYTEQHLLQLLKSKHWPDADLQQIDRFKFSADRKSRYTARLLLCQLLNSIDQEFDFCSLRKTDEGKPYFQDSNISFNWSHSADLSLLAFSSDKMDLGIDIEQHKGFNFEELSSFMTCSEREMILSLKGQTQVDAFYHFWTCKESVMKACGKGLLVPPNDILIVNNQATLFGKNWFLTTVETAADYSAQLCSSLPNVSLNIVQLSF